MHADNSETPRRWERKGATEKSPVAPISVPLATYLRRPGEACRLSASQPRAVLERREVGVGRDQFDEERLTRKLPDLHELNDRSPIMVLGSTVGSSNDPTTKINKEAPSTRRETRRSTGLDHSSGFWGRGSGRSRVRSCSRRGRWWERDSDGDGAEQRGSPQTWHFMGAGAHTRARLGSGEHRRLRTLARPCGGIDWELVEATGLSREQIAENEVASR
jgi:hypothetical protein